MNKIKPTGLKDINGRPIYMNDIVSDFIGREYTIVYDNVRNIFEFKAGSIHGTLTEDWIRQLELRRVNK
jgi:hypothetical protein